jgi:mono/diheme cytochrome c family protein
LIATFAFVALAAAASAAALADETVSSPTRSAASSRLEGAGEDYMRACQGCHGAEGCTDPAVIPPLRGSVGYFTRSAQGREYLVRVPGVALSALDDERLARLLNWMLDTMSAPQVAPDFRPYRTEEVALLRREALTEVVATRARLVEQLAAMSVPREALQEGHCVRRATSYSITGTERSGVESALSSNSNTGSNTK